MPCNLRTPAPALAALALLPALAWGQVTVKPDGQWRHLFGLAGSHASGNTDSSSLNLSGDSVRATEVDRLSLLARALYARNEGTTSANRGVLAGDYNRDFSRYWFGFGRGEFVRDRPANLARRFAASAGVGHHLIRDDNGFWDVSVGLGYTRDRFVDPVEIKGRVRDTYSRPELVLAEESNLRLTQTTSWRQKLAVLPNLEETGTYRAEFDSAIAVAVTQRLSLTAGFAYRYNSDPGEGVRRGDSLVTTGVSLRMD
ncbi:DUF481 domain-containing protein [Caldimonas brevitalea]|uniref:Putative salt-induced outer membrane protein n=1 Tax=Caldimonas brevitalea TaxID=413882 RepID=A0A0G3BDX9_9BURK|nr:DUF481 domain-containing protein [Caldimonas brevitalea]AKJ27624.1 putative salt-induced outer membrane protein [Caldimonas brevitalea]